jgi:hypothetical protein
MTDATWAFVGGMIVMFLIIFGSIAGVYLYQRVEEFYARTDGQEAGRDASAINDNNE